MDITKAIGGPELTSSAASGSLECLRVGGNYGYCPTLNSVLRSGLRSTDQQKSDGPSQPRGWSSWSESGGSSLQNTIDHSGCYINSRSSYPTHTYATSSLCCQDFTAGETDASFADCATGGTTDAADSWFASTPDSDGESLRHSSSFSSPSACFGSCTSPSECSDPKSSISIPSHPHYGYFSQSL